MLQAIQEVLDRRDLLYMITWREIRVKYKQSVMGMLWAVVMPSAIVCAGVILRDALAALSGKALAVSDLTSVAANATPRAFFVSALRFGTNSIVANTNVITKFYLSRLVSPVTAA